MDAAGVHVQVLAITVPTVRGALKSKSEDRSNDESPELDITTTSSDSL